MSGEPHRGKDVSLGGAQRLIFKVQELDTRPFGVPESQAFYAFLIVSLHIKGL